MRRILPILFLSLVLGCTKDTDTSFNKNPYIELINSFGGTKNESAQSVINTNDGGYLVAGYTQSIDGDIIDKTTENFDYWLLKFDASNDIQWSKTYGGSGNEKAYKVIQTNDNGFALIGYTNSNDGDVSSNMGLNDVWLVKLDASGTISWEKSFGFSGNDKGFSIIQTIDGGYFINGIIDVTASNGEGNNKPQQGHAGGDYWGIRLDANGNKVWRNYFGGSFTDTSYDCIETDDAGFILIGSSDSNDVDISGNKGSYDFWIVKIDMNGSFVWEKTYGGSEIDEARSIVKTSDGNYIIVGDSRSSNGDISSPKGAADMWLIKISPSGDLLWEKSYGGSNFDVARNIKTTLNNGFIIVGNSRSQDIDLDMNQGQNDIWIVKINDSGDLEWQKSIGGSNVDSAYSAVELNDDSIVVVGESSSSDITMTPNKGFTDLIITKIAFK